MAEPFTPREPTPPRREFKFGVSDIGIAQEKKPGRAVIEDVVSSDPKKWRFALFDGTISALAPQAAVRFLEGQPVVSTKEQIRQLLGGTHKSILETKSGGQSTATILQFFEVDGQIKAGIGNVGDSRAYRWNPARPEQLERLTTDDDALHNVLPTNTPEQVEELARISKEFDEVTEFAKLSKDQMPLKGSFNDFLVWERINEDGEDVFRIEHGKETASELELFMIRHLTTNALGRLSFKLPEPDDITVVDVNPGDFFLLGSDGMANLTTEEITDILVENSGDPQLAADKLKNKAVARSGERELRSNPDDISDMVIRVPSLIHSQPGSYS